MQDADPLHQIVVHCPGVLTILYLAIGDARTHLAPDPAGRGTLMPCAQTIGSWRQPELKELYMPLFVNGKLKVQARRAYRLAGRTRWHVGPTRH